MTVSILTVSRGPNDDTEALVRALERSSSLPDELIVVWCGTPKRVLSSPHFAIVDVEGGPVPDDDGDLSDARNLAAQAARGGCLIFVDPDCLPSRTMIENFIRQLMPGRVVVGERRALHHEDASLSEEQMYACSWLELHQPLLPDSGGMRQPQHYFQPAAFAISRPHFVKLGGFESDTRFRSADVDWALWTAAKARCFRRARGRSLTVAKPAHVSAALEVTGVTSEARPNDYAS